jgi:hypothetical protein
VTGHQFGKPLVERDYEMLSRSFIPPELAEQAGLRRVDSITGAEMFGCMGKGGKLRPGNYAGVLFQNKVPGQDRVRDYRLRLDEPELERKSNGEIKEKNKYRSAPGASNLLYFPPGVDPGLLADTSIPIVNTEGEKKCLALWHLAWYELGDAADRPRWLPVALSGVNNWKGKISTVEGPDGGHRPVKGPIRDLDLLVWKGRNVIICYDSNAKTNDDVRIARFSLAKELRGRGAHVLFVDIPAELGVNGIDDVAGQLGPEMALKLLAAAYDPKKKPATTSAPEGYESAAADEDHQIAEDLLNVLHRYIAADDAVLYVLAIWILHTHSFLSTCSFTPYLVVTSAEKQSGKTRVLEVLKPLVRSPLMTGSISPAALARTVDQERPTFMFDEYDVVFKGDKETAEMLRGILNSGFHIAGSYTRMVGQGGKMEVKSFSTFCPKALSGIGPLWDTVQSRSIVIRLKRAQHGQCQPFRPDGMSKAAKQLRDELEKLRQRAGRWAHHHTDAIANCEPVCPAQFNDRQCDISEPLFAIAEVLDDSWPERMSRALSTVFASPAAEDTSKRVLLLGHIRKIFLDEDKDRLRTEDLIAKLCGIEDAPWSEWNRGKNITAYGLSKLLRDFEIRSRNIRDPVVVKGYLRDEFLDAFQRYLGPVCTECHEACSGSCSRQSATLSANVYRVVAG